MTLRANPGAIIVGFLAGIVLLFAAPTDVALAATFVVNDVGDASDETPGDGQCRVRVTGRCTFRAAVEEANANSDVDIIQLPELVMAMSGGGGGIVGAGANP